mgnify:CR=1 FL=1
MPDRWPALLNRELAAEYLAVSLRTFDTLAADGRVRPVAVRGNHLIRFRKSELDDFIDHLPRGDSSAAVAERGKRLRGSRKKQLRGVSEGSVGETA